MGLTSWVDERIAKAVDKLYENVKVDLLRVETDMLGQIAQLPGLVASQIQNVLVDAGQIAEKVADALDIDDIVKRVINGIDIPFLPKFAAATPEEIGRLLAAPTYEELEDIQRFRSSKAAEIYRKLEEKRKAQNAGKPESDGNEGVQGTT